VLSFCANYQLTTRSSSTALPVGKLLRVKPWLRCGSRTCRSRRGNTKRNGAPPEFDLETEIFVDWKRHRRQNQGRQRQRHLPVIRIRYTTHATHGGAAFRLRKVLTSVADDKTWEPVLLRFSLFLNKPRLASFQERCYSLPYR